MIPTCYELNVFVPPKFICQNPTIQCDGVRRWGLWEVISSRGGHEGGALINGIHVLIRVMRELAVLCSLPCEDTKRRQLSVTQKRVSLELDQAGTLNSDLQPPEL